MQRNFILTDVMKTGAHQTYEQFLDTHSLPDQIINHTGEYYTLHNYNLDSYDRKFAMIDRTVSNHSRLFNNTEYQSELTRRVKLLHSQGFKFILATPWESYENTITGNVYPKEIGIKSFEWTGGTSWFWFYMYHKHLNNKFKFTHDHFGSYFYKKYDFLYLNKQPREHR